MQVSIKCFLPSQEFIMLSQTHTHTQKDASFHSCDQTGFSKRNSPQCETCRRWRLSSLHLKNDGRRHDSMSFSTGSECTEKLSTSTQTLAKSNQITQDGEKILSPQLKISPPLFPCFHEHHPPHPPTLPKNMSFAFIYLFFTFFILTEKPIMWISLIHSFFFVYTTSVTIFVQWKQISEKTLYSELPIQMQINIDCFECL